VQPFDRPAMLRIDDRRTIWFLRDGTSRRRLRAYIARDSALSGVGVVGAPLDDFAPIAAPLPDGRILLITGGLGKSAGDPPAATYLTSLAVRCPAPPS
jgi:hypothetical protein